MLSTHKSNKGNGSSPHVHEEIATKEWVKMCDWSPNQMSILDLWWEKHLNEPSVYKSNLHQGVGYVEEWSLESSKIHVKNDSLICQIIFFTGKSYLTWTPKTRCLNQDACIYVRDDIREWTIQKYFEYVGENWSS